MILAPNWALISGALEANDNESHLRPGIHLRVLPSPTIGLPATPLFVYRAVMRRQDAPARPGVRWVDSHGNELTPPFDLSANNPVIAWLPGPPAGKCVWLLIDAEPPRPPVPLIDPAEYLGGVTAGPTDGIEIEACISTERGRAVVGRRRAPVFVFSAPRIDYAVIRGTGKVKGAQWMTADDLLKAPRSLWRVWSLPVAAGPRYTPTANALADADARVAAGAPLREPLYAAPFVADPVHAPTADVNYEKTRVGPFTTSLSTALGRLVSDMSASPSELAEQRDFSDQSGKITVPLLKQVLQSALDPGIARWLGLADVDISLRALSPGDLVLYLVRGLWHPRTQTAIPDLWRNLMLAPGLVQAGQALLQSFPDLGLLSGLPTASTQFYDLAALMSVTIGSPPDRPAAPTVVDDEDAGWRADVIVPDARRVVRLNVSGLSLGAQVAFAVRDNDSANTPRELNPRFGAGVVPPSDPRYDNPAHPPLPLSASILPDKAPGAGRFEDRNGHELGGVYRLYQSDWFGRWSMPITRTVGARARTAPPMPVLELSYVQPAPGTPPDLLAKAGTFTIAVSVPRVIDLPAGGRLLTSLLLATSVNSGVPTFSTFQLPATAGTYGNVRLDPAPSDDAPGVLYITVPGPALLPAASATVSFTGQWYDGTSYSLRSIPVARKIQDPRPLPAPVMPVDLFYAQRPDALGKARVELPLPASTFGYRVFYTAETTALGGLELLAAGSDPRAADAAAALAEIRAAAEGAPRAQKFGKWKQLLDWSMFENVTPEPYVPATGRLFFPHALSASLQGLALYRVLSVAESGALSDFATAPLVTAVVPNFGPPPQPFVAAAREATGVRLQVKVPLAVQTPVAFRVRRSSVPLPDVRQTPVTAAGSLTSMTPPSWLVALPTTTTEGTTFEILDPTPLKNWRRYYWAVEVQASPPPGAPADLSSVPPGEWSLPSSPASIAIVPDGPPGQPQSVLAARTGGDVNVTVTLPADTELGGNPIGSFHLEVFRRVGNVRPARLDVPIVQTDGVTFTFTDEDAPDSATYTVRIVDPLGRRGGPVSSSAV